MFPQLPAAVRVFLCTKPTDMRESFDGLFGMVQEFLVAKIPSRATCFCSQSPPRSRQGPLLGARRSGHLVQAARGRDFSKARSRG